MKKNEKKDNEPLLSLARRRVFGWACLFLFVSGWMFVLGIFVGRGTAPVQFDMQKIQNELTALKEAVTRKAQSEVRLGSDTSSKKPNLEFYEELKNTKKDTGFETRKPVKKLPPKKVIPQTSPGKVSNATGKKLTIQVAAVKDQKVADQWVEKLKKKGYSAYRVKGKVSGNSTWYRIRVGHFKSRGDALKTLNRLKQEKKDVFLIYE
jgi:cell division septation protein DedD